MKLKTPKVSKRMEQLVELAIDGAPFWDMCCDHGYIGIRALESNRFSKVIFVDSVKPIIDRLSKLIAQSPLQTQSKKFQLINSKCENLDFEIFGTCVIAGVGGRTIINILDSLQKKDLLKAERILLSAHTDETLLLDFLSCDDFLKSYTFQNSIEIAEGKRFRKIIILTKN